MFANLLNALLAPTPKRLAEPDAKLALAALMVRIARTDHLYAAEEVERIERVLMQRYGLDAFAAADAALEQRRLELALEANVLTDAVKANGFGVVDPARLAASLDQIATTYTFTTPPDAALYFTDAYLPAGGFKLTE